MVENSLNDKVVELHNRFMDGETIEYQLLHGFYARNDGFLLDNGDKAIGFARRKDNMVIDVIDLENVGDAEEVTMATLLEDSSFSLKANSNLRHDLAALLGKASEWEPEQVVEDPDNYEHMYS